KVALFATVENALESLEAAILLARHLVFDRQRLAEAAADPMLLATDAAEELVAAGRRFRKAHEQIGELVREGKFVAPWDAARSVAKRKFNVVARAKALRREAANLTR